MTFTTTASFATERCAGFDPADDLGDVPTPAVDADALRQKALRLLARREHSRKELARKLAPGAEAESLDALLARLEELGLLSDRRFAESYVRSHAGRFGIARLRYDLSTKGIAAELADQALASLVEGEAGDELARARELWLRRFTAGPVDAREYGRQTRFLQGRGFSADTIRKLLKEGRTEQV